MSGFSSWSGACTCLLEIELDVEVARHGNLGLYRKLRSYFGPSFPRQIFHNGRRGYQTALNVQLASSVAVPSQPLIISTKHRGHANALAFHRRVSSMHRPLYCTLELFRALIHFVFSSKRTTASFIDCIYIQAREQDKIRGEFLEKLFVSIFICILYVYFRDVSMNIEM